MPKTGEPRLKRNAPFIPLRDERGRQWRVEDLEFIEGLVLTVDDECDERLKLDRNSRDYVWRQQILRWTSRIADDVGLEHVCRLVRPNGIGVDSLRREVAACVRILEAERDLLTSAQNSEKRMYSSWRCIYVAEIPSAVDLDFPERRFWRTRAKKMFDFLLKACEFLDEKDDQPIDEISPEKRVHEARGRRASFCSHFFGDSAFREPWNYIKAEAMKNRLSWNNISAVELGRPQMDLIRSISFCVSMEKVTFLAQSAVVELLRGIVHRIESERSANSEEVSASRAPGFVRVPDT